MKRIFFAAIFLCGFSMVTVAQSAKKSEKASDLQAYDKQKQEEANKLQEKQKRSEEEKIKNERSKEYSHDQNIKMEKVRIKKEQEAKEADPHAAKLQELKTMEVNDRAESRAAEKKASLREREKKASQSSREKLAEKSKAETEHQQ